MLYTDVYTAARLMNVTTSCVYKRIHHAGGWWAEGIIHTGKKYLLPLSKVAHMTERTESDLAEEIWNKRKPRLCLLDLPKEEVQRLKRAGSAKARKRESPLQKRGRMLAKLYIPCPACVRDLPGYLARNADAKCLECGEVFCGSHISVHLEQEHGVQINHFWESEEEANVGRPANC